MNNSRFLTLILRHKPDILKLTPDNNGWVDIEHLVAAGFTKEQLKEIVVSDKKNRFAIEGSKIRANYGHSFKVDLNLEKMTPPEILYHGTIDKFLDSILKNGLNSGQRNFVHLSCNIETALKVAKRREKHGKTVILRINSGQMKEFDFYRTANDVWLVKFVPIEFLDIK